MGGAKGNKEVVMPMPMHQGGSVRSNFDLENANVIIVDRKMVRRFGGDLHLGSGGQGGQQREKQQRGGEYTFHGGGLEHYGRRRRIGVKRS